MLVWNKHFQPTTVSIKLTQPNNVQIFEALFIPTKLQRVLIKGRNESF